MKEKWKRTIKTFLYYLPVYGESEELFIEWKKGYVLRRILEIGVEG